MENTYFITTCLGTLTIVSCKEFNDFLEVLNMMHPDYMVKWSSYTLCGHEYKIKHFYFNEKCVCKYICDALPFD